jgi:hypothetical protein
MTQPIVGVIWKRRVTVEGSTSLSYITRTAHRVSSPSRVRPRAKP